MSVIQIDSTNYQTTVEQTGKVIVKVSSSTCAPCKVMTPIFKKLAEEFDGVTTFAAFEVVSNEDQALARSLNISSVPVFIVYENGEITSQIVGAFPSTALKTKLGL